MNNETEMALLELEHRFGKTVRDQVEQMGFVIPKTGQWKVTPIYITCSECGESFFLIPQNYCPNCGAKMEGGVEGGNDEVNRCK